MTTTTRATAIVAALLASGYTRRDLTDAYALEVDSSDTDIARQAVGYGDANLDGTLN